LLGGAAFFLLIVVACVGTGYYVAKNAKSLIASAARNVAVQMVEASELPADDKQQIVTQIDRVVEEYKKGRLTEKDFENILTEIQHSRLLPVAVVYFIDKAYLDKSGLTDDEKANARLQLQRIVRGGMEEKITEDQINGLMAPLMETTANGQKKLKQHLTDDELKKFAVEAQKLADDAMIPNEKFEIDIGDEVKQIVDRGLEKRKP